ncbi:hypothetical protein [Streptomyces sp. NPDC091879]|uniref:hypothetical protein n=1 Tax=Streptomyces sp. NPDC091879 TaxID=3366006 RepID=UPI0038093270
MKTLAPLGPTKGESYVLENAEGHGAGLGHIPSGSVVSVVDVHPAGTAGVGHAGEASVLLSCEHDTHVITDDGSHAPGKAVRHFSLHLSDFERMFKKVDA